MWLVLDAAGGIFGMALLSRLFLWMSRKRGDNVFRIVLANSLALVVGSVLAAFNMSVPGQPPEFIRPMITYSFGAIIWLVIDLIRLKRRRTEKVLSEFS